MVRGLAALFALGCAPSLDGDPARIDAPRVLAIRAEPAEAAPGGQVRLAALIAGASGGPRWAWCTTGKPIAESRVAAQGCLEGQAIAAIGEGPSVEAALPANACALFGSEPPPPMGDSPPLRPVDPDPSGGWYQPVRATLGEAISVGRVRLRCALPGAPADVARRFAMEYLPNAHPQVTRIGEAVAGASVGEAIALAIAVDPPEDYLRFVSADARLETVTETLVTRWYTDGGRIEGADRAARWTADRPGEARVWVVVSDDRGGVGWALWTIEAR